MFHCVGGPEAAMSIARYRNFLAQNQDADVDALPRHVAPPVNPADFLAERIMERANHNNMVDSLLQAVHSEGFFAELIRSAEQGIIEARNNFNDFDNYVDYRYIEPSEGVAVVNDILRSTCSLKDLFENKCEVENGDN